MGVVAVLAKHRLTFYKIDLDFILWVDGYLALDANDPSRDNNEKLKSRPFVKRKAETHPTLYGLCHPWDKKIHKNRSSVPHLAISFSEPIL